MRSGGNIYKVLWMTFVRVDDLVVDLFLTLPLLAGRLLRLTCLSCLSRAETFCGVQAAAC